MSSEALSSICLPGIKHWELFLVHKVSNHKVDCFSISASLRWSLLPWATQSVLHISMLPLQLFWPKWNSTSFSQIMKVAAFQPHSSAMLNCSLLVSTLTGHLQTCHLLKLYQNLFWPLSKLAHLPHPFTSSLHMLIYYQMQPLYSVPVKICFSSSPLHLHYILGPHTGLHQQSLGPSHTHLQLEPPPLTL